MSDQPANADNNVIDIGAAMGSAQRSSLDIACESLWATITAPRSMGTNLSPWRFVEELKVGDHSVTVTLHEDVNFETDMDDTIAQIQQLVLTRLNGLTDQDYELVIFAPPRPLLDHAAPVVPIQTRED